jgi:hypothetical protein
MNKPARSLKPLKQKLPQEDVKKIIAILTMTQIKEVRRAQ